MSGSPHYSPSNLRDPQTATLVRQNEVNEIVIVHFFHWLPIVFFAAVIALVWLNRRAKTT